MCVLGGACADQEVLSEGVQLSNSDNLFILIFLVDKGQRDY